MKKLRLYLDTSVINFLFADDAPDFKQVTLDFFENQTKRYELYISDIVILEIDQDPDEDHKGSLFSIIDRYKITILPDTPIEEIKILAQKYIEKGIIPNPKINDALHVAYATIHNMDILLSWNFKHLANVNKEIKIQLVNIEEGYRYPLRLVSPLEVLND